MNILVVGDGDLSFSRSLVTNAPDYIKVYASCIEDEVSLYNKYCDSKQNAEYISQNGGTLLTNVDATKLENADLDIKFELIIFNFPHTGGKSNIKRNRNLLSDFFVSVSCSGKLLENGVVCVTLCRGQGGTKIDLENRDFKNSWQIEENAAHSDFLLFDAIEFDPRKFSAYSSTGYRSQDKRFLLEGSRTYVFRRSIKKEAWDVLMKKVWLNKSWYYTNSWIVDILSERNNLVSNQLFIEQLIGENTSGYTWVEWQYVLPHSSTPSYRVLPENVSQHEHESAVLTPGYTNVLCSSIDDQITHIINTRTWTSGSVLYTSGFCFYPASSEVQYPCQKFMLVFRCAPKSMSDTAINIECGECTVSVKVYNLSDLIRDIDWPYMLMGLQGYSTVSQLYRSVFTNDYESPPPVWDEFVLEMLQARIRLDVGCYRDISFWCRDEKWVANEIEEIVRCVFGMCHWMSRTKVLEQYNKGGDRMGMCVRMYLTAGGSKVLDRGQINRLQSCVRIKAQDLLHVTLR